MGLSIYQFFPCPHAGKSNVQHEASAMIDKDLTSVDSICRCYIIMMPGFNYLPRQSKYILPPITLPPSCCKTKKHSSILAHRNSPRESFSGDLNEINPGRQAIQIKLACFPVSTMRVIAYDHTSHLVDDENR